MRMNVKRDQRLMILTALLAFGLTGCLEDAGLSTEDIFDLLTADNDENDPSDVDMDDDGIPDGSSDGDADGDADGDTDADTDADTDVGQCSGIEEELQMCWENVVVTGEAPEVCIEIEDMLMACLHGTGDPADECIALEEDLAICYEENPAYPEACIGFEEMLDECMSGGVSTGTDPCEPFDIELQMCWEEAAATGEGLERCVEIENMLMACLDGAATGDPASDPCGDIMEEINLCRGEFAATGENPDRCIELEELLADCGA